MRVADLIVATLMEFGVDRVFSVPGESFLGLLDALRGQPEVDLVTCRHEGSAGLAAVADAKLTGGAGVVMVSRGPGIFNASIALHVAEQEAIPLVVFVGQVDMPSLGRGAVQEVDCGRVFSGVIKGVFRIDKPLWTAEVLRRAFSLARHGTPGPVIVELPEDVLLHLTTASVPVKPIQPENAMAPRDAQAASAMLATSKRPLVLVGGECRTKGFRDDLKRFCEQWQLPIVATNKNQDQFSNSHPNWAGQLGFFSSGEHIALLERADLLLAIGTRLGDLSSIGFRFPRQGENRQLLIHVHPDPSMLDRHFTTDLAVAAGAHSFVRTMLAAPHMRENAVDWMNEVSAARGSLQAWPGFQAPEQDILGHAITACAARLTPTGIVTTDSGNFAAWVHRIFRLEPSNRLLGSACGAMGSGVPAGVAAALRHPGRQVLVFCGDGGFLMNGNELATAVERHLDIKIIISNNKSYGTIRSHQQRTFPGRVSGTDLTNPSFAAVAKAFGAAGYVISSSDKAEPVIEQAFSQAGPVVIEILCDPDYLVQHSLAVTTATVDI